MKKVKFPINLIWLRLLHEDIKLKKLFPSIDVVTRQTANIKRRIMRNRYTTDDGNNNVVQPKPAGTSSTMTLKDVSAQKGENLQNREGIAHQKTLYLLWHPCGVFSYYPSPIMVGIFD